MSDKTYEGTIVNGNIQLPAGVKLPENSRVLVIVPDESEAPKARIHTPRLADPKQAKDFQMDVEGAGNAGV